MSEEYLMNRTEETMVANFEKYKCPTEIKSSILKSIGLHLKDMKGSTAYLANTVPPVRKPSVEDLKSYAGLPSQSEDIANAMTKMAEVAKIDRAEI